MAINYSEVGWNSGSYLGPTNFNHMDEGIKAACDQADENAADIISLNESLAKFGIELTTNTAGIQGIAEALNTAYSNLPTGECLCILIIANSVRYQAIGYKNSDNFATFIVHSYGAISAIYHLRFRAGTTWSYAQISTSTEIDITL